MKRPCCSLAASVLAVLLVTAESNHAQTVVTPAPASNASSNIRGTIAVGGTAQVLVVPDPVELRLGITTRNPDLLRISAVVNVQFETLPGAGK